MPRQYRVILRVRREVLLLAEDAADAAERAMTDPRTGDEIPREAWTDVDVEVEYPW